MSRPLQQLFGGEMFVRTEDRIDNGLSLRGKAQTFLLQKVDEFLFGTRFLNHRHPCSIFHLSVKSTRRLRRASIAATFFGDEKRGFRQRLGPEPCNRCDDRPALQTDLMMSCALG